MDVGLRRRLARRGWGAAGVNPLRWWRDWRIRRAALAEMAHLGWRDEAVLLDQSQNPITLAKLSLAAGELEAAEKQWQTARTLLPKAVLTSGDSVEILLGLKRYDEAEALVRERGKQALGDFNDLTDLARIAEHCGDIPEALKRWKRVRIRVRDSSEGFIGCARCLVKQGRLDEAESQLNRAIRRDPGNLHAQDRRATISDLRKNWVESLARWQLLARLHHYPPAFACAANAMLELGQADAAEAWLAEPSRLYSASLDIAVTRARIAERRGDAVAACDRWATVRAVNPWFTGGYRDGARCLADCGRHAEANALSRAAAERFPHEDWPSRGPAPT
jgi:tetratricopeptide (TPR) repeat protein